jgi:SAM-dependent methyltransferase
MADKSENTFLNPKEVGEDSVDVFDHSRFTTPDWYLDLILRDCEGADYVLEVGCGTGRLSAKIDARTESTVVGLDIDSDPLRVSPYDSLIRGDAAKLPFPSSVCDVAVSVETIEHLPADQPKRMLTELRRVLKPDGVLFLKTPNRWMHDVYQLSSLDLRRSRQWHPSLFTHRSLAKLAEDDFDVAFYKADMAEYQIQKLDDSIPGLGEAIRRIPFRRLPFVFQPSIYARLTVR